MRSLMHLCLSWLGITLVGCGTDLSAVSAPKASPVTVSVAAAADLKFALDEVIAEFEQVYPQIDIRPTYGSSGNFFAQLSNRAPYDMFFSADIEYPRKLAQAGHAVEGSEFIYAVGQIVVWVRDESPLDVERLGPKVLLDRTVRKVALANPQHAPYGRAAQAALSHLGIYDQIQDRLVLAENIAQAAQFVESGAADVGIIALSLAMAPALRDKGRYVIIPLDTYPRLEQGGVIMTWSTVKDEAMTLRKFVMSENGRTILRRYGFLLPGE